MDLYTSDVTCQEAKYRGPWENLGKTLCRRKKCIMYEMIAGIVFISSAQIVKYFYRSMLKYAITWLSYL